MRQQTLASWLLAVPLLISNQCRASHLVLKASGDASASAVSSSDGNSDDPNSNPTVQLYRRWAKQYEKDAEEAEAAAAEYAREAKAAVAKSTAETHEKAPVEVSNVQADTWVRATEKVEDMLTNDAPAKGAAAAAAAAKPYNDLYAKYEDSKNAYNSAAVGYALRAQMDSGLAKQLQTYANQFHLQGNKALGDTYQGQATMLMKQATTYKGMAEDYDATANRIYRALPEIQKMAGMAGAFAAYGENPTNAMSAKDVYPFTVAPPLSLVQTGDYEEESQGQAQGLRR